MYPALHTKIFLALRQPATPVAPPLPPPGATPLPHPRKPHARNLVNDAIWGRQHRGVGPSWHPFPSRTVSRAATTHTGGAHTPLHLAGAGHAARLGLDPSSLASGSMADPPRCRGHAHRRSAMGFRLVYPRAQAPAPGAGRLTRRYGTRCRLGGRETGAVG